MEKHFFLKSKEELQEYLQFKRRGSKVELKKVKGLILESKNIKKICAISSAGRAHGLHPWGQRFEPVMAHQTRILKVRAFKKAWQRRLRVYHPSAKG